MNLPSISNITSTTAKWLGIGAVATVSAATAGAGIGTGVGALVGLVAGGVGVVPGLAAGAIAGAFIGGCGAAAIVLGVAAYKLGGHAVKWLKPQSDKTPKDAAKEKANQEKAKTEKAPALPSRSASVPSAPKLTPKPNTTNVQAQAAATLGDVSNSLSQNTFNKDITKVKPVAFTIMKSTDFNKYGDEDIKKLDAKQLESILKNNSATERNSILQKIKPLLNEITIFQNNQNPDLKTRIETDTPPPLRPRSPKK